MYILTWVKTFRTSGPERVTALGPKISEIGPMRKPTLQIHITTQILTQAAK